MPSPLGCLRGRQLPVINELQTVASDAVQGLLRAPLLTVAHPVELHQDRGMAVRLPALAPEGVLQSRGHVLAQHFSCRQLDLEGLPAPGRDVVPRAPPRLGLDEEQFIAGHGVKSPRRLALAPIEPPASTGPVAPPLARTRVEIARLLRALDIALVLPVHVAET